MSFEQLSFLSGVKKKSKASQSEGKQEKLPKVRGNSESHSGVHQVIWKVHIDGAARNNPGPAGAGICIFKNDVPVVKKSFFLGNRTNNQAEYLALLLAIKIVKPLLAQHDRVHFVSDSQLLVRQIAGAYKVKEPSLQKLHACALAWLAGISFDIMHVGRLDNICADELANVGIDKKIPVPKEFVSLLSDL